MAPRPLGPLEHRAGGFRRAGTRTRAVAAYVAYGVVAVAVLLNLLKAVPVETQRLVWPFWSVTYRHGFVRRGLVGSIFHALGGRPDDAGLRASLAVHRVAVVVVVAVMVAWAVAVARRLESRARLLLGGGVAAALLSPLVPTLGQNAGYFDVYLVVLALVGAWAAYVERFLLAAVVASIGPFVHDAFVFLWAPVVIAALPSRPHLRRAPLLVPFAVTAVVQVLHSNDAVEHILAETADTEALAIAYRMALGEFANRMREVVSDRPEQLALGILVFFVPSTVAVAFAFVVGERRTRVATAAATLVPCTILAIAWDLSRFLVWSALGAFVALLYGARADANAGPRTRASLAALLVALAIVAAGGPHLYAYFHVAYGEYATGPSALRTTPAATIAYAWLRVFNRRLYARTFEAADERCALEPWDARREGTTCVFVIPERARVETPFLWLPEGSYVATVRIAPDASCTHGAATVAARGYGLFAPPRPAVAVDAVEPTSVEVVFAVDAEQAALGRQRVVVEGREGCLRLEGVDVRPLP